MKRKTVYVLIYNHVHEVYQQVLGVFTTSKKAIKSQSFIPNAPTSLYQVDYEYDDPPFSGEYVWVETKKMDDGTVAIKATNIFDTELNNRTQSSFINPEKDYVVEYVRILETETDILQVLLDNDDKLRLTRNDTSFDNEEFDLGDDNMNELRKMFDEL